MRKSAGIAASRSFWRHERGNAAIEFGIVAPLLLLMLLGTVELGRAIATDRHFGSAVASTGDLVAREEYLGEDRGAASNNLKDMMTSIQHLMRPYDPSTLQLVIYSVKASADDPGKGKVEWSYPYGLDAKAQCSDYALPADVVPPGGSVIVVEAEYTFTPLFGDFIPGLGSGKPWSETSYHSPRNSCVDYVKGDNCISKC